MDNLDRRVLLAGLGVAGGSLLARVARAGDLTPPAGPVAPTMKPLDQVEPRTPVQSLPGSETAVHVISQPGSYYLTADLVAQSGLNGIEIVSSDVSLDLCGFSLIGPLYSGNGIVAGTGWRRILVRNGRVQGWRANGIDLSQAEECCVEAVVVSQVAHTGISVGTCSSIERCLLRECSTYGVVGTTRVQLGYCQVHSCPNGIQLGYGSSVQNCTVSGATSGIGFDLAEGGQHVRQCSALQCATGFALYAGSVLQECLAAGCTTVGVLVQNNNNFVCDCHMMNGGTGLSVAGASNFCVRNTASANTTNYSVVPGNAYGPIVNVAGAGNISGTPSANHPAANFSH